MKSFLPISLILLGCFVAASRCDVVCNPVPGNPQNAPIGSGRGLFPGRVVWTYDPNCCKWDGQSKFWFQPRFTNQTVVDGMLVDTVMNLAGAKDVFTAWTNIFRYHNKRKFGYDGTYRPGEKIAIKVNLNGDHDGYADNNGNEVSPQFLLALLKQLIGTFKVPQEDITILEPSRTWTPHFIEMVRTVFPLTNWVDNKGDVAPGTVKVEADFVKNTMFFSSKDMPSWNDCHIPTVVSDSKYLLLVNNFRGHDLAGITASGKNFFGAFYDPKVDCVYGEEVSNPHHWCPANLHDFVDVMNRNMSTWNPEVDFLGHPKLGDNLVAIFTDGLYAGPSEDQPEPIKFQMYPFNNGWTSSLFAAQDAVAMDSVLFDFIRNEPAIPYARMGCVDNYLHEAALADHAPSGTVYRPDGVHAIGSLGVHEHWNNAFDKQYSKNMGRDQGIELIQVKGRH